ncbi:DUF3558 domain-containing protein [Streptomyces sp. NPDC046465]|uniref:DUF3558 domain-containing protein n=1 Tax=Streptomyces sp. NPDC046465 TaxID=3155810 RepID=UPI0033E77400
MQRKAKACVPGVAALLAAILTGCSGGSGLGDESDDAKPGGSGSSTAVAQPGKYRTLPEPCGEVDHGTLDAMLPGIVEMEDTEQREKAYEGTPTVTYDTDRRVGCNWKIESSGATHHLLVDFERVVSYDGTVSDDARAAEIYASKLREAGLTPPSASASEDEGEGEGEGNGEDDGDGDGTESGESGESGKTGKTDAPESGDKAQGGKKGKSEGKNEDEEQGKNGGEDGKGGEGKADGGSQDDGSQDGGSQDGATSHPATPPPGLEPRTLPDLGDEAFLDDALTTAASASRHRTVTVVFRTSNVIVTIEYDEQPGRRTDVPDSKEMQDKAQDLADRLAGEFNE